MIFLANPLLDRIGLEQLLQVVERILRALHQGRIVVVDEVLRSQYLEYDDDAALVQSTKDALHDLQQLFEADAVEERVREEDH